jgi:RHS repeat-associated protein
MCPSIAVAGGGGAGGGGSGGAAGSGSGEGGPGTSTGKEDAEGGGKGAADPSAHSCGAGGGGGSCPVHHPSGHVGHPIDVVTGRAYTEPAVDVHLPGPIVLTLSRSYSSAMAERDVGLGFGWSHSLAWELEVSSSAVTVSTGDGRAVTMDKPAEGAFVLGREGWVLQRLPWGFTLHVGGDQAMIFSAAEEGGRRWRLTALQDRNGNRVSLSYDAGRLVEIIDGAGRVVRVQASREGRIAAFEVKNAEAQARWICLVRYGYDERGDLVTVSDPAGYTTEYAYDEHRMIAERDPTGLTFHYIYDQEGRAVETWGDYPGGADSSLAPDLPAFLHDGVTRAKGVHHAKLSYHAEGYSEADDSTRTRRFHGNRFGTIDKVADGARVTSRAYDEHGNAIAATDPLGATTTWERDARGLVVRQVDALGGTSTLARDAAGNLVELVDEAGRKATLTRDVNGNVIERRDFDGAVWTYAYDARGLVTQENAPNGGTTRFAYDAHGNLVELALPNGAVYRFAHDWFGRRTSILDPTGGVRRFVYDDRGLLVQQTETDGTVAHYHYDGAKNLVHAVDRDGRPWSYEYGGYHVLTAIKSPDGAVVRVQYDREGQIVRVLDPNGEAQTYERDAYGDIVAERAFDGLERRWRRDRLGQVVRYQTSAGDRRTYERDALGRVVSIEYADGSTLTRTYDPTGMLVATALGAAEVRLERDPMGRVTSDKQVLRGVEHRVDVAYDVMGEAVRRRSTAGLVEDVERDVMGTRTKTVFDRTHEVRHEHDLMGQELRRALPGGGLVESTFDERRRLRRRAAVNPSLAVPRGADEPEWVGRHEDGVTAERAYTYSGEGNLLGAWDRSRGGTQYEHDPIGRLLSAVPAGGLGELFRYDLAGNVAEAGPGAPGRRYGRGNRLLERGNVEYVFGAGGFLEEKIVRTPKGEERHRYAWNAQGLLEAVDAPGGLRVELAYDPLARRLEKRVLRNGTLAERTRFVWDGHLLADEVRERATADGDPIVEERSYAFEDWSFRPMAQRRAVSGGAAPAAWDQYVNGPAGAPEALVDERGDVVWEAHRKAFGEPEPSPPQPVDTPFGLAGQYHDAETGLSYNRYRYYDPEVGRFLSRDPLELEGGINVFAWEVNPLTWTDPLGLTHFAMAAIGTSSLRPANGHAQFDSTQTGAEFDALRSRHNPQGSEGLDRQLCHTEQKACEAARNRPIRPGETLHVNGTLPPCNNCKGAMNDLAADTGCNVVYNFTDPTTGEARSWTTDPDKGRRAQARRR